MSQSDDEIDLSVLDDDDDDRVLRRKTTTATAPLSKPTAGSPGPDDEFELFLRRNRERNEEKARIESMLDQSRQAEQTARQEIERIRDEIAREEIAETRAETFDLDQESELTWIGPAPSTTALRRPVLKITELTQLLQNSGDPGSSEKLSDLLIQPIETNAFCRRFRDQRPATHDLIRFLWHLAATHSDPFVVHRAAMLMLAVASNSDREPMPLVTLDQIDLPLTHQDRRRDPLVIKPAAFLDAFLANGSRNVPQSEPVTSGAEQGFDIPANVGALLVLLAGCIDMDPGQYAAQTGVLLPYLAAFLIDPQSSDVAGRVEHCLFRLLEAAAAHHITVAAVIRAVLDDHVARNLSNKYRILAAMPHTKFGTAVAKQAALQVICDRLQITEDATKVQTMTPIERLVAILDKAALHDRCEQLDVQYDLATLIRLQNLIVFRRQPLTNPDAIVMNDVEKAALQSIVHTWQMIKDNLPNEVLNKPVSMARDVLVIGLRIAEQIVDRATRTCY